MPRQRGRPKATTDAGREGKKGQPGRLGSGSGSGRALDELRRRRGERPRNVPPIPASDTDETRRDDPPRRSKE